jgi:hypothetical protein
MGEAISDVLGADGKLIPVIYVTYFQGGGAVFWSQMTGAAAVDADIVTEWAATAGETLPSGSTVQQQLGAPTGDEANVNGVANARVCTFQGGVIYWSAAYGAYAVSGDIGNLYQSMGGPTSWLGLPTSDVTVYANGNMSSSFENGQIVWTPQTGAYAVQNQPYITFSWQNISFGNGTPVGGSAEVILYPNGNYVFRGSFHDGGVLSYNDTCLLTFITISGFVWSTPPGANGHSGHMNGTLSPGSRDDNWNDTSMDPDIANNYQVLEANPTEIGVANVSWDGNDVWAFATGLISLVAGLLGGSASDNNQPHGNTSGPSGQNNMMAALVHLGAKGLAGNEVALLSTDPLKATTRVASVDTAFAAFDASAQDFLASPDSWWDGGDFFDWVAPSSRSRH